MALRNKDKAKEDREYAPTLGSSDYFKDRSQDEEPVEVVQVPSTNSGDDLPF